MDACTSRRRSMAPYMWPHLPVLSDRISMQRSVSPMTLTRRGLHDRISTSPARSRWWRQCQITRSVSAQRDSPQRTDTRADIPAPASASHTDIWSDSPDRRVRLRAALMIAPGPARWADCSARPSRTAPPSMATIAPPRHARSFMYGAAWPHERISNHEDHCRVQQQGRRRKDDHCRASLSPGGRIAGADDRRRVGSPG